MDEARAESEMERRVHFLQARRRGRRSEIGCEVSHAREIAAVNQFPNAQKGTEPELDSRSCLERAFLLCLLNLDTSRRANVVLARAVEECRHVVNLNHSHVDVLSGVNVQAAAESHRKCR